MRPSPAAWEAAFPPVNYTRSTVHFTSPFRRSSVRLFPTTGTIPGRVPTGFDERGMGYTTFPREVAVRSSTVATTPPLHAVLEMPGFVHVGVRHVRGSSGG